MRKEAVSPTRGFPAGHGWRLAVSQKETLSDSVYSLQPTAYSPRISHAP